MNGCGSNFKDTDVLREDLGSPSFGLTELVYFWHGHVFQFVEFNVYVSVGLSCKDEVHTSRTN